MKVISCSETTVRKKLDKTDTVRSHMATPNSMQPVYNNKVLVLKSCIVVAKMEPYIPNQKIIDKGFMMLMSNPVINERNIELLSLLLLEIVLVFVMTPSIPV